MSPPKVYPDSFHEFPCADPVPQVMEVRCFKTWLAIRKPQANGNYRVPVYHVFEEEIEPVGLPKDEDDDYLAVSERGLDNATSAVHQPEATEVPWASPIGDIYTEMNVAYEEVKRRRRTAWYFVPQSLRSRSSVSLLKAVTIHGFGRFDVPNYSHNLATAFAFATTAIVAVEDWVASRVVLCPAQWMHGRRSDVGPGTVPLCPRSDYIETRNQLRVSFSIPRLAFIGGSLRAEATKGTYSAVTYASQGVKAVSGSHKMADTTRTSQFLTFELKAAHSERIEVSVQVHGGSSYVCQ
ncbi:hypothetical protein SprV_0401730900 [Sparganum proliferum]